MPAACRALQAWTALAELEPGSPVFRPVDQHNNIASGRLTGRSVSEVVKSRMRKLEHRARKTCTDAKAVMGDFSGHSLRAGFATSAAANVPVRRIQGHTRHASVDVLNRYIRESDLAEVGTQGPRFLTRFDAAHHGGLTRLQCITAVPPRQDFYEWHAHKRRANHARAHLRATPSSWRLRQVATSEFSGTLKFTPRVLGRGAPVFEGGAMWYGLLFCLLVFATPASAATIEIKAAGGDEPALVIVQGRLLPEDADLFRFRTGSISKAVVVFESEGGSLFAGIEIGRTIRLRNFATLVPRGVLCASACAIAWLGGTPRMMEDGALIGFHAAYRNQGGYPVETGRGTPFSEHILARSA